MNSRMFDSALCLPLFIFLIDILLIAMCYFSLWCSCEDKCLRSFHPNVVAGAESFCESLGYNDAQVEVWTSSHHVISDFTCQNEKYYLWLCIVFCCVLLVCKLNDFWFLHRRFRTSYAIIVNISSISVLFVAIWALLICLLFQRFNLLTIQN